MNLGDYGRFQAINTHLMNQCNKVKRFGSNNKFSCVTCFIVKNTFSLKNGSFTTTTLRSMK